MPDYPDFTITALLKGTYDEKPKALSVDFAGNMIAMLKGQYENLPKNVELDASGNININLVAQGLDEIINRFKFGAPYRFKETVLCADMDTTPILEVLGKGQVYMSHISLSHNISHKDDFPVVELDGTLINNYTFAFLNSHGCYDPFSYSGAIIYYDDTTFQYGAILTTGFTFETKYVLKYANNTGSNVYVRAEVIYSLIYGPL